MKAKRLGLLVLSALLTVMVFAGCSKNNSPGITAPSEASQDTDTEKSESKQSIKLKMWGLFHRKPVHKLSWIILIRRLQIRASA